MGTLEDIKNMQAQGTSEDQIINSLQEKGVSYREISEALAQSKIKAAVEAQPQDVKMPTPPKPSDNKDKEIVPPAPAAPTSQDNQEREIPGMQRSMLQDQNSQPMQEYTPATPTQEQSPDQYAEDSQYGYGGYDYQPYDYSYSGAISPDTITEMAEQIVAEKILETQKSIEGINHFRTVIESKTESMEERLRRLEEVIHALQSSVLRKVGDYVTNVSDIKKELIETQKSLAKIAPGLKKHSKPHLTPKKTKKKKK